ASRWGSGALGAAHGSADWRRVGEEKLATKTHSVIAPRGRSCSVPEVLTFTGGIISHRGQRCQANNAAKVSPRRKNLPLRLAKPQGRVHARSPHVSEHHLFRRGTPLTLGKLCFVGIPSASCRRTDQARLIAEGGRVTRYQPFRCGEAAGAWSSSIYSLTIRRAQNRGAIVRMAFFTIWIQP